MSRHVVNFVLLVFVLLKIFWELLAKNNCFLFHLIVGWLKQVIILRPVIYLKELICT